MNIANEHLLKENLLGSKQITKDTLGEGKLIEGDIRNALGKIAWVHEFPSVSVLAFALRSRSSFTNSASCGSNNSNR